MDGVQMIILFALAIIAHVGLAIIAYGRELAFFQRRYPTLAAAHWAGDVNTATAAFFLTLFIPVIGAIVTMSEGFKYGLLYRKPTKEEPEKCPTSESHKGSLLFAPQRN